MWFLSLMMPLSMTRVKRMDQCQNITDSSAFLSYHMAEHSQISCNGVRLAQRDSRIQSNPVRQMCWCTPKANLVGIPCLDTKRVQRSTSSQCTVCARREKAAKTEGSNLPPCITKSLPRSRTGFIHLCTQQLAQ